MRSEQLFVFLRVIDRLGDMSSSSCSNSNSSSSRFGETLNESRLSSKHDDASPKSVTEPENGDRDHDDDDDSVASGLVN